MKIVIGDIHGCFDELMRLLDNIGPGDDDTIITVGDMIDRGPKSPEVVTFFARKGLSILGNHERKHVRYSLGLMNEKNFTNNQRGAVKQFHGRDPQLGLLNYEEALAYFKTLPLYLELSEAIIVHAGLIYGTPLDKQNERVLTGAGFREENELNKKIRLFNWCDLYPTTAKPVICGHHGIGEAPWPLPQRENLWPIDTGCAAGGYLTAVTLPDFNVYQVRARKRQ